MSHAYENSGPGAKAALVFIGLDSSGSMEYLETDGDIPACVPPIYKKNRWAIAQEVLTGTFESFTCSIDDRSIPTTREDYGYPVPHVIYDYTANQKKDGLIDSNYDRFKFAFARFDTEFGTDTGATGGWSYGPVVTISALIDQLGINSVNLGIRMKMQLALQKGDPFYGRWSRPVPERKPRWASSALKSGLILLRPVSRIRFRMEDSFGPRYRGHSGVFRDG